MEEKKLHKMPEHSYFNISYEVLSFLLLEELRQTMREHLGCNDCPWESGPINCQDFGCLKEKAERAYGENQ